MKIQQFVNPCGDHLNITEIRWTGSQIRNVWFVHAIWSKEHTPYLFISPKQQTSRTICPCNRIQRNTVIFELGFIFFLDPLINREFVYQLKENKLILVINWSEHQMKVFLEIDNHICFAIFVQHNYLRFHWSAACEATTITYCWWYSKEVFGLPGKEGWQVSVLLLTWILFRYA